MKTLLLIVLSLMFYGIKSFVDCQLRCSNNDAAFNNEENYVVVDTPMTWSQARQHCQAMGDSDLVVVDNDEEMTFLQQSTMGSHWIGVNDEDKEGEYRRTNSEQDTESYPGWLWHSDEPSSNVDTLLIDDDCGLFTMSTLRGPSNVHGLGDEVCFALNQFICEDDTHPCNASQYYSAESCGLGGRYIVYNILPMSWMDARDRCQSDGRELASLITEDEVRFLRNGLLKGGYYDDFWVGLSDQNVEGTWEWTGHEDYGAVSETFDGRRWNPNEPNGGSAENCVEMTDNAILTQGFNDLSCNLMRPFICEKSASVSTCVHGSFLVYRNHRLINHVTNIGNVTSMFRCIQECLKDSTCLSVNMIATGKKTNSPPWQCELNSSNKDGSPMADYMSAKGAKYAEF